MAYDNSKDPFYLKDVYAVRYGKAIPQSDTQDLTHYVMAVAVTAGSVKVLPVFNDDNDPITMNVAAGQSLPWQIRRVFATGTTASLCFMMATDPIVALDPVDNGGDTPNWVPADAKIYIDLVNDRAWTEADGIVAIDTLLGSDPNTANGWDATSYDAGNLTADGYVFPSGPSHACAFIGSAGTFLLEGATITIRVKNLNNIDSGQSFVVVDSLGNNAAEVDMSGGNLVASSWAGPLSLTQSNVINSGIAAINVMAITLTGARLEVAVNGGEAIAGAFGAGEYPTGTLAALVDVTSVDCGIQSIAIYDPLPDTTGLSALSQTGVTNTAPTAISASISGDAGWGGVSPAITITAAGLALISSSYPVSIGSVLFHGADAEGNPTELTVVSDTSGKVSIASNELLHLSADITSDSPVSFTIRATDPGGLYVEQTFTITVTADTSWVPANANIYIDFVGNRAWTAADGEVAIVGDVLKFDDPDWIVSDPANIVPGSGLRSSNGGSFPRFTDAIQTSLLDSGFTLVAEFDYAVSNLGVTSDGMDFDLELYSGDFNQSYSAIADGGQVRIGDGNHAASANSGNPYANGRRKVAVTMLATKVTASLGGTPVTSVTPDSPSTLHYVGFNANSQANNGPDGNYLRTVTIYAPVVDADLPALSRIIPANAKIYIDLVQNWAWTEADGEVAIDTLLGADANTANGWGISYYDSALLDGNGLAYGNNVLGNFPAFIGAARTSILAAATCRFQWIDGNSATYLSFAAVSADGNDGVNVSADSDVGRAVNGGSYNGSASLAINNIVNSMDGARNVLAVTITGDRLDFAVNGSDAVSEPLDNVTDRPTGNPLVAALIDFGDGNHLQSITIYDALPDTTGLSALSQTGVTNTAPTAILFAPTGGSISVSGSAITIDGSGSGGVSSAGDLGFVTATDAEGNPLTFALVTDVSGKFSVGSGGGGWSLSNTAQLTDGESPYTITIRATDPGGLYVEQTFTITVTA